MITQTLARSAARPRPGWGLWAAWIIATVYGTAASLTIFATMPGTSDTVSLLPRIVIIAMIISLAQWPVLYRYLPNFSPRQWLGANVLGSIAAFITGWASIYVTGLALYDILKPGWETRATWALINAAAGGAGTGAALAVAQWLALRPYLRGASRWIVTGAAAWAWAGAAAVLMQNRLWEPIMMMHQQYGKIDRTLLQTLSRATGLPDIIVFAVLVGVVGGLLIGGITGLALVASVRARAAETE